MLRRFRKKHPIGYSAFAEVLFLAGLLLVSLVVTFVLLFAGVKPSGVDEYLLTCIQELVGIGIAVFLLARTGRLPLLRRRGSGFFNGLLVGMYPLVLIGYSMFSTLMFGLPDGPMKPAGQIVLFLLGMTMVGIAEELIFRAVIAQTLLEHFGTSRAGVFRGGAPVQPAQLGPAGRADAVCLHGIAGHPVCGYLLPHRQHLGHRFSARGNGHCVHAGRRPLRHGNGGGKRQHLRLLDAVHGCDLPDPNACPAAEKEAAGGTAVLGQRSLNKLYFLRRCAGNILRKASRINYGF